MRAVAALSLLFASWMLTLNSLKAEDLDVTCYSGVGRNYRGTVARTASGKTCQSWSVQTPHSHSRTPENHPCSGLENNNYCRNPDYPYIKKPWCFTTDPQKRAERCDIPRCVGVPQPEPIVPELTCFTACGENYRGTVSTTTSGRTCQRWLVQTPHSHEITLENFPHAGLENNNHCRSPDGEKKPWCYTTDPQQRWEFCDIPRCVSGVPQPDPTGPKNVLLAVDPPGDVVKGSSVTLTCSASGSHPPVHSCFIYKDNSIVAQTNTMTISNVQPSHSGTYHCEAFNDIAGVNSPPVTVDVHYPPEIPSVSVSPPGGVVVGSTVTLSCSSDASPPVSRYTWYKDSRFNSTGPQLVKDNVSPADSGQYVCLVTNTHGSRRSPPHSLDVQPPMLPTADLHCGPPEVYLMNRIMINKLRTAYRPRARVLYECMVGYTSTRGRPDVTCVAGKWTRLTLKCESLCGRLAVQTGTIAAVLGGTLSRPGQHPWQVSLQRRAKGTSKAFGHACGGALIGSCWVLTAAHCIKPDNTMDMRVVVGGVDNGSDEEADQVIDVKRHFIHSDYWNETLTNDIALLQLSVTDGPYCAKETSYVKPACLPNKIFPDGKPCVISGWGSTNDATRPLKMSHGGVTVMAKDRCVLSMAKGDLRVDNTMICAEDKTGRVNFCSGDSGGPLVCKDSGVHYVSGLVSWVDASCSGQKPGVYAEVYRHVEWIATCIAHDGSQCRTLSVNEPDEYDYSY